MSVLDFYRDIRGLDREAAIAYVEANIEVVRENDRALLEMIEEIKKSSAPYQARLKQMSEIGLNRWILYEPYLETSHWRKIRSRAWAKVGYRTSRPPCRACVCCSGATATEIHHLTYDRMYQEPLWDLEPVCLECHKQLHKKGYEDKSCRRPR